jgi:hypothetical protein
MLIVFPKVLKLVVSLEPTNIPVCSKAVGLTASSLETIELKDMYILVPCASCHLPSCHLPSCHLPSCHLPSCPFTSCPFTSCPFTSCPFISSPFTRCHLTSSQFTN